MASLPFSTSSELAAMEHVFTELFAKIVRIILESRSPYFSGRNYNAGPSRSSSSSSTSSNFPTRDNLFDLTLKDCPTSLGDLWPHSNLEPLVVDVILNHRKEVGDSSFTSPAGIFVRNLSSERDQFGRHNRNEKIVERWILQSESQSITHPVRDSSSQGNMVGRRGAYHSSEFQDMYRNASRKISILLRSLYSAVRLLPAYKLFIKVLNASGQKQQFSLSYRISSFAEPFSREEDAEMSQVDFGPLDIFSIKVSLSVVYLKTLQDVNSEPPTRIYSEFIMDYVGSPLADPLKRFPCLPIAGSAPSYATFIRQNSWCNNQGEIPFPCPTPHTYSDSRALYHNSNPILHPRCHLAENFASSCSVTRVSSAPFSSPSSTLATAIHLQRNLSSSESAPISIPLFRHRGIDGGQKQILCASSCTRSKRQGCPQLTSLGTQGNTTCAPQTFSPENKLHLKKESLRLMEFQTDVVLPKTPAGKDRLGHITGLITSSYSPTHLQSRSARRLSFMDEFDDSDFICHFAEDDDAKKLRRIKSNISDDHAGENLLPGQLTTIRSPDAAVGALVWMLRKAPALGLANSNALRPMQVFQDKDPSQQCQLEKIARNKGVGLLKVDSSWCLDITTPELCRPKTVADARKELMTYKGTRELILKQSESRLQDVGNIARSITGDPSKEN